MKEEADLKGVKELGIKYLTCLELLDRTLKLIDSQVMCSCKADQRKCNSCDLYSDIKELLDA